MPKKRGFAIATEVEEQLFVYEHRLMGLTLRQIVPLAIERFQRSFSLSTIHRRYQSELKERTALRDDKVAELRTHEVDVIDRMVAQLHDLTHPTRWIEVEGRKVEVSQKPEHRIAAAGRILEASRRRSELLGLNAPTKIEASVEVLDGTDLEIRNLLDEFDEKHGPTKKAKGKKKGKVKK